MAIEIFKDASVVINSVDLSDHVESVALAYSAEAQEATVMGDTGIRRLAGLLDWSLAITFRQDYDASEVDATIFSLVGAAAFSIAVRKSKTDGLGVTNPEYQGNGVIDGDYTPMGGTVGEVHGATLTVVSADGVALIRAV